MKIYNVFAKPKNKTLDALKIVPEGFNFSAFFFNVLWLLYYQLWDFFIVINLILLCIINLAEYEVISPNFLPVVTLTIAVLLGAFGNDIASKELKKKGYKLAEVIAATSIDEAELKFLNKVLKDKKTKTSK